jgi:hypothetical protein
MSKKMTKAAASRIQSASAKSSGKYQKEASLHVHKVQLQKTARSR